MFGHRRSARLFYVLSEITLAILAFRIAYQIRVSLHWHFLFYLTIQQKALILGFSLFALVTIGVWLEVYDALDSGHLRTILRDSVRQCVFGAVCVLVFEYALRMELSRFFLALYAFLTWSFIVPFRLTAGRVTAAFRREFPTPHYVMVVGTGERAVRIARVLEQSAAFGVRLRGFFSVTDAGVPQIAMQAGWPIYPLAKLSSILRQHVVDEIVFAVDSGGLADLEQSFLLCDE